MAILKQGGVSVKIPDLRRDHGISNAAFYEWRLRFGGVDTSMIKRLKELIDEIQRLKKMYTKVWLNSDLRQEALEGKVVRPSRRREIARKTIFVARCSVRLAFQTFCVCRIYYRYRTKLQHENADTANSLVFRAHNQRNWGFRLYYLCVRNVKEFR